jgi:LPS O-antigen subunit length determinant protein (WzzB/FepE family)
MKLVTILAAVLLSGCAGFNLSFVAKAKYKKQATTNATMTPGAK